MKRLVVFLCVLGSLQSFASHIVGGEIELLHVTGFQYRVNLIYYFDVVNNPGRIPELQEPTIDLFVYRKSDDKSMGSITLKFLNKNRVPYTQPNCSQGEIISDKLVYTTLITLSADLYSDPKGYYMIWTRCCRNYTITNVVSQTPGAGIQAGQTFYLEFPPVTKNGVQFINSSPSNFPALNDYACPSRPYFVNFGGTDTDGDSLAYSLVTPLSTISSDPYPPPSPQPYPDVTWTKGFGLDRVVNGSPIDPAYPDLKITNAGFLTVSPRSLGLYVFAVKVEEFRNKIKIGEVRRDFQMLVTDCRISVPPVITGKAPTDPSLTRNNLTVHFDNTVTDDNRYVLVNVSDLDATRAEDNFEEVITIKVIGLNVNGKDLTSFIPTPAVDTIHNTETINFKIPIPKCPLLNGTYRIGVIAFDDACALPQSDTLNVTVDVQPPNNQPAKFNPPNEIEATLSEGTSQSWPFEAHDAEGDSIIFSVAPEGFLLAPSGMTVDISSNLHGNLNGLLTWDAFCDIYNFTKRTDFTLNMLADDKDVCDINPPDKLTFNLHVILPPNAPPIVDTDLTTDPEEVEVTGIEKKIFDSWSFNVTGKDLIDNPLVTVRMEGDGYKPSDYGMSFAKASAIGTVTSRFNWDLACDQFQLDQKDTFNIAFVAVDSINKCRVRKIDSLVVQVKVLKPDNSPPRISFVNLSADALFDKGTAIVSPGQELNLQLNVTDADTKPIDQLTLKLIGSGGDSQPAGFTWSDAAGPSVLSSPLTWAPLCTLFSDGLYEHNFYFDFRYSDDRCLTAAADTMRVNVTVKDKENNGFLREPPNVFTPNGDQWNEWFSMEITDETTHELINILPIDNCQGVFQHVKIYNRWGEEVFSSNDRNFRWYGTNQAAGVYYYLIIFSNKEYKGLVSLRD